MTMIRNILALLLVTMVGCATAPKSVEGRQDLARDARNALAGMVNDDPSLGATLRRSYAYVVFPSVGEGGFIIGGTYGRGVVFRDGQVVGYADLKGAKVGLLAGGQSFDQLVVLRDRGAFNRLVNQGLDFTATAQATAITAGVAAKTQFRGGMAVFVKTRGGLMGDLSLGGQEIDFVPRYASERGTRRY